MRPALLAIGLFLLAPLVAEFLLGNLPITALGALLLLAPLYGGAALLIRELSRRRGAGWPTMLVLALAYGVLEEGITTMSLFNPNYAGQRLLDNGAIPVLGIGVVWTGFVLGLHTVWSISAPIAVMEVFAGPRRTTPWLSRPWLATVGLVFLVGVAGTTAVSIASFQFVASAAQLVATAIVVVALVALAFVLPARAVAPTASAAPSPWLVGGAALVASSVFKQLPRDWNPWLYVCIQLALAAAAVVTVRAWSARPGWGDPQRLALAAGALLTYAWTAFPETPVLPASPTVDLLGNTAFAAAAVLLVAAAALSIRRRDASAAHRPLPLPLAATG
jgi:hypothetical protein